MAKSIVGRGALFCLGVLLCLAPASVVAEVEIRLKDGRVFSLPIDSASIDAITVDGTRYRPDTAPGEEVRAAPADDAAALSRAGSQGTRLLSVGPGREIELPSEAARVARDGDVIEIDAAEYFGDVAVWRANDLTLRGVGGIARLDAGGRSAQGKAIWVIKGDNVLVENIEFSNAAVPDRNGAGIRIEGANLIVRNSIFRDNENGILGGGKQPDSSILIENSEFSGNGYGDGQSHGIYIGTPIKRLTFRYNYVHHSKVGHQVKSLARENFILYNKLVDEESGTSSYAIDLPRGGFAVVMGNVLQQGRSTENSALVHFASAVARPGAALYLVNNTVVNERHAGVFLRNRSPVEARLLNNVLVGNIELLAGRGTGLGNIRLDLADFVDPGAYDFRLRSRAAAIDAAANPGEVAGSSLRLTPSDEYVHPRASRKRPQVGRLDAGAFEFQPAEQ